MILAALLLTFSFHGTALAQDTVPITELRDALPLEHRSKKAQKLKKGWTLIHDGKFDAAKRAVAALLDDADFGDHARWVSAQSDLASARALAEKNRLAAAANAGRSARTVLEPIATKYPYTPWLKLLPEALAEAEAASARGACEQKKWQSCETQYESALERRATSSEMSHIGLDEVSAYALACTKKKTETCSAWIQRLAEYYPQQTEEFKALIRYFPEYENGPPKRGTPSRLTQTYHAPDPDQAAIDQAVALELEGKADDAAAALRKFLTDFPKSLAQHRARYWLARALDKQGRKDESKKTLEDLRKSGPLTFYGLLADLASQTPFDGSLSNEAPKAEGRDPFLYPDELYHLKRAENLLAEGANELAAQELSEIKARNGLSNEFLSYAAWLHAASGDSFNAFHILNELIARGYEGALSDFFVDLIFPQNEIPLVRKVAEPLGADPILVASLVKQESSFNAAALSGSGAIGLMQLMPATAAETSVGRPRTDLFDQEKNLRIGTIYLGNLLARRGGNIVYALASYNAGPTAVDRWIKAAPPGGGMLEFIESIPYKETREYVCAIIRNYFWYSKRLNPAGSPQPSLDFFWEKPKNEHS